MSIGLNYLSSLLSCNNEEFYKNLCPKQYLTQQELFVFDYIYENVVKYNSIPTKENIQLEFGIYLPSDTMAPLFYMEKLEERFLQNNIRDTYEKVALYLNKGEPKAAFNYLESIISKMHVVKDTSNIFDFRQSSDILTRTTLDNLNNTHDRIQFGWPYLDDNYSNIYNQQVISVLARTGMGKTFTMLYIAYNTWLKYQQPILFFTMEMSYRKILQRLAGFHLNCDLSRLDRVTQDTIPDVSPLFETMQSLKQYKTPFYIVDAGLSSSLIQVQTLIKQCKARVVFVDGAYLLKTENSNTNRFEKAAQIMEMLKRYSMSNNLPIIASWQFNREAAKKKNAKDVGLEDIGLSDTISHFSSLVLSILQDNELEKFTHRDIYILKGSDGQFGNFKINFRFNENEVNMSEVVDSVESEIILDGDIDL